jgi:hypothetical protein
MSDNLYLPWPYAAKAIVEYFYDGNEIFVWITFRLPMNINFMPDLLKWIFKRDGFLVNVTSSIWLDPWTLYLVTEESDSFSILTCEYLGPGPVTYNRNDPLRKTLETTWGKQWEPWGPIRCHNVNA